MARKHRAKLVCDEESDAKACRIDFVGIWFASSLWRWIRGRTDGSIRPRANLKKTACVSWGVQMETGRNEQVSDS